MRILLLFAALLTPFAHADFDEVDSAVDNVMDPFYSPATQICTNDNCEDFPSPEKGQVCQDATKPYSLDPNLFLADAVIKYYSFEDLSRYLSKDLELAFDAFIFVNTAQTGKKPPSACSNQAMGIPPQFGKIIWKKKSGGEVFQRNAKGEIVGLLPQAAQEIPGLQSSFSARASAVDPSVLQWVKNNPGHNFFPASTGNIPGNIAHVGTPSGIFGVDYSYTVSNLNRTDANKAEHMPFTLLADYHYGQNFGYQKFAFGVHGTPEVFVNCQFEKAGRTFNAGCMPCGALKGSPAAVEKAVAQFKGPDGCMVRGNEKTLGVKRDSAGCMRTFSPTAKVILDWAMTLKSDQVPKLDNMSALPTGLPLKKGTNLKLLMIPFDGYSAKCGEI